MKPKSWLNIVITISMVAGLLIFLLMRSEFDSPAGLDAERLGQLGDFLGGTLNPLLGFCTVMLLLWTNRQQQIFGEYASKQLELTRDETTRAQMQDALESLYRVHNETLDRPVVNLVRTKHGNFRTLVSAYEQDLIENDPSLAGWIELQRVTGDLDKEIAHALRVAKFNLFDISTLTAALLPLLHQNQIKNYWFARLSRAATLGEGIGAIKFDEKELIMDVAAKKFSPTTWG